MSDAILLGALRMPIPDDVDPLTLRQFQISLSDYQSFGPG